MSTCLVINGVHLCQHQPLNHLGSWGPGKVCKSLVELGELIHCIIAHKSLAHKQGQVWLIQVDQIAQSPHQWLVVLHASCR